MQNWYVSLKICITCIPFTCLTNLHFRNRYNLLSISVIKRSVKRYIIRLSWFIYLFIYFWKLWSPWICTDLGSHWLFIYRECVLRLQAENPLESFIGDGTAFSASLWDKITSQSFLFFPLNSQCITFEERPVEVALLPLC